MLKLEFREQRFISMAIREKLEERHPDWVFDDYARMDYGKSAVDFETLSFKEPYFNVAICLSRLSNSLTTYDIWYDITVMTVDISDPKSFDKIADFIDGAHADKLSTLVAHALSISRLI